MKKFVLFFTLTLGFANDIFASDLKFFEPVKLKNPVKQNLQFKADTPKDTLTLKTVASKPIYVIDVLPTTEVKEINNLEISDDNVMPEIKKNDDDVRTDKNIDEARELLKAAEKLANSVKEEDFVSPLKPEDKVEVVKQPVKKTPDVVVKFKPNQEDVSKSDVKKVSSLIQKAKDNQNSTLKIMSYYTNNTDRNIAFSRLLNTRKIFLDKGIPTSQTMIMVLEDETHNKDKTNSVEILFIND